jgi:hypothetical protein
MALAPDEIEEIEKQCTDRCKMYKILIKYMHTADYEEVVDICSKVLTPIINK